MKKLIILLTIPILFSMVQCKQTEKEPLGSPINKEQISQTIEQLIAKHGEAEKFRIERGVNQVANLWRHSDGSVEDFNQFCNESLCNIAQLSFI